MKSKKQNGYCLQIFSRALRPTELLTFQEKFFFYVFIEYQNVILATILGELVRIKFSL